MQPINKFILTLISLIVFLHSVSLYTVPEKQPEEAASIEMTQDDNRQEIQIQAYDALIPSIQGVTPLVWYFIHEVVLLTEAVYHEMPVRTQPENRFLEILFPLIISPNGP
ncbi:MAG: hypothetical protein DHS20C17_12700 [Cyclobacteriaceae bacterium]|nr:MAG: hypothetical protein DHS20C17_12700 [Cyclobacteriaceae bacterium]